MTTGLAMPKKTDPTKQPERGTTHVRVMDDVAEWIGWIYEVEGISSAILLDPLIRSSIEARYKRIETIVETIKEARSKAGVLDQPVKKRARKKASDSPEQP